MAGARGHAREMKLPGPPSQPPPLQRGYSKANSVCVPTFRTFGNRVHMPALGFMLQFSEQKGGKGGDRNQEGREGEKEEEGGRQREKKAEAGSSPGQLQRKAAVSACWGIHPSRPLSSHCLCWLLGEEGARGRVCLWGCS